MKPSKGKIGHVIQAISILPILFFGAILLLLTYWQSMNLLKNETKRELSNASFSITTAFNSMFPGDYELIQAGDGYTLQKGKIDVTREYDLFDTFHENTGYDISLYYENTVILSTLESADGKRMVGVGATERILTEVLEAGEAQFYEKVLINRKNYFCYYLPLKNMDGSITGMLCVCKSEEAAIAAVNKTLIPILFVIAALILVLALILFLYTRNFVTVLTNLNTFLDQVSGGNLNAELSPSVTRRNDEFGAIGRSVVKMQDSLRHLLEQDALTKLFNRHFGDRKLRQVIQKCEEGGTAFALAIGDIDFFKKVNDTYGHDCGDVVLKNVASVLRDHMLNCGFVARWGGEEFLLVFDKMNMYQASDELEKILDKIRAMDTVYDDQLVKVTMTFGVTEGPGENITTLLKSADDKLYNGKQSGRNRVIV